MKTPLSVVGNLLRVEGSLSPRWPSSLVLFRRSWCAHAESAAVVLRARALSSALCSALPLPARRTPTNTWQGFGKRKNAVGMARPKKKKVEVVQEEDQEDHAAQGDDGEPIGDDEARAHAPSEPLLESIFSKAQLEAIKKDDPGGA